MVAEGPACEALIRQRHSHGEEARMRQARSTGPPQALQDKGGAGYDAINQSDLVAME
jgi:hypothetical protein